MTELFTSSRLSSIPRSGIRRVLERTYLPGTVSLAAGDPDFATPHHIVAAATAAMERGETHYTHGRGLPELREAFAAKLRGENGIVADPATEIVVTAGALNALASTFLATVDPGEGVIVPDPGFANYAAQVALAGGRVVPLALTDALSIDLHELERLASTARVLVINTPGNPTGVTLSRAVLEGVSEIAIRHDLLVIADEAYEHLVYDEPHVSIASLPGMAERTISIHSMSKSWSMTGWRIGFATGPADVMDEIAKAQEHLIGCPPAMTQWGAVAALTGSTEERDVMVERYRTRRALVIDSLQGLPGLHLVTPTGAFYAFPRFEIGVEGYELADIVADGAGVITIPGVAFGDGGSRHLRISYALPEERLTEGLDKLAGWLTREAATDFSSIAPRKES
ncbi:MAG: pyridoxal phosphate-dependent aminotransferase [Rhodoglobus sp.]